MSQPLDTLKICERKVGVFRHRNNNIAAEKQLQQRKQCKKHYFLVVGLEWWCLKKRIAKEIENYELTQVNTLLERFYVEIKNKHG